MCLIYILLVQPDLAADSSTCPEACNPPSFLANSDEVSIKETLDTHNPSKWLHFSKPSTSRPHNMEIDPQTSYE